MMLIVGRGLDEPFREKWRVSELSMRAYRPSNLAPSVLSGTDGEGVAIVENDVTGFTSSTLTARSASARRRRLSQGRRGLPVSALAIGSLSLMSVRETDAFL